MPRSGVQGKFTVNPGSEVCKCCRQRHSKVCVNSRYDALRSWNNPMGKPRIWDETLQQQTQLQRCEDLLVTSSFMPTIQI